jgi:hypothetical protein
MKHNTDTLISVESHALRYLIVFLEDQYFLRNFFRLESDHGQIRYISLQLNLCISMQILLLLSRSRLCHYSIGGAWWHICSHESFF